MSPRVLALAIGLALATAPGASAQEAGALEPGVFVQAREERYPIEADHFTEMVTLLNEMRLGGEDAPLAQGSTRYNLTPRWRYRATQGGCEVSSAEVHVDLVITLPRWERASRVSVEDRRRWLDILADITRHEYQHRDITVEAAGALVRDLRTMSAATCGALESAVNAKLALVSEELKRRHAAFDEGGRFRP